MENTDNKIHTCAYCGGENCFIEKITKENDFYWIDVKCKDCLKTDKPAFSESTFLYLLMQHG